MDRELRYPGARVQSNGALPFVDEFERQVPCETGLDHDCCGRQQPDPSPGRATDDVTAEPVWDADVLKRCAEHELLGVEPERLPQLNGHPLLRLFDCHLRLGAGIQARPVSSPDNKELGSKSDVDRRLADLLFAFKDRRYDQTVGKR